MYVGKVKGVASVLREFIRLRHATEKKAEAAVLAAALFVLRLSQKVVPIDTSALKNSGRARKVGRGFEVQGLVEYTVAYAIYVHENMKARHKPGKQAKFVEGPMRSHRAEIIALMRKKMGLK